jgi:hypothetical protein
MDTDLGFLAEFFTGPSLGVFAPLFSSWVTTIISVVWFGAIVYVVVKLVVAVAKLSRARQGYSGYGMEQAIGEMVLPMVALILLCAFTTLITVLG